jgi:hypothetical protein
MNKLLFTDIKDTLPPVKSAIENFSSQENPDSAATMISVESVEKLSQSEQSDRLHLEHQVERAFYEAGKALRELHSRKLYRNTHKTFEEYCQDRFGFERRHPYRLIEATKVVDNLRKMCPNWTQNEMVTLTISSDSEQILPTNESQVRPLVSLEPEVQRTAWELSVQEAGGKVPSARLVQSVVDKIQQPTKLTNPYKIGEVCQIIAKNNPLLKNKGGCWGIITHVNEHSCTITTRDGEYSVRIENLKYLEYSDAECQYMQDLCQRLKRLHLVSNLDVSVDWLLSGLSKQLQPSLTPLQEKFLAVAEEAYEVGNKF